MIGKRYPWGDQISARNANYIDTGGKWDKQTAPASFKANGYGLYDMADNGWEWCESITIVFRQPTIR